LLGTKRFQQADSLFAYLKSNIPDEFPEEFWKFFMAIHYAIKGENDKALDLSKYDEIYALLNMKDEAISEIQKTSVNFKKRERSMYNYLKNSFFYDNLRSDHRFQEIIKEQKKIYEENLRKYGDIDL